MNNTAVVDILHGLHDGANQSSSVGLMVVTLGTYPVEKFPTGAQVEAKIQIVGRLKVIVERDDILMATGYALQDCDLIPDLRRY